MINIKDLHKREFITHLVGMSHFRGHIERPPEEKNPKYLACRLALKIFLWIIFLNFHLFLSPSFAHRNEHVL